MRGLNRGMLAPALVTLALSILLSGAASAEEPPLTRERSPGGVAYRHVSMPGDTHQALFFAWKGGLATDDVGREPAAGFTVRMLLEGPKGLTRSQLIEAFRDLQANTNLGVTGEHVRGNLVAPAARFAPAAELFARVLNDPAMPQAALPVFLASRAAELRQGDENPQSLASRLMARLLIAAGTWRNVAYPEAARVEAVTMADVEAFRRNVLTRDNLEIVAAGPLGPEAVGPLVDRLFGAMPATGRLPKPSPPDLRHPGRTIILERPVVQTIIVAAGPTTAGTAADLLRAEMATTVLSGGFGGRLFKVLRGKLGATYGVTGRLQPVDAANRVLVLSTAVANDKAVAALEAVRAEYARALAGGLEAEEIDPLKTTLATRHADRIRRAGGRASAVMDAVVAGRPDDDPVTFQSRVGAVTLAEVNGTLRRMFPKSPLTLVVIAPSAEGLGADCVIKAAEEIARCE